MTAQATGRPEAATLGSEAPSGPLAVVKGMGLVA